MTSEPPNLLAPSVSLMVTTLAALFVAVGLGAYLIFRFARAIGARSKSSEKSLVAAELQQQVNALTSQVHELDQAQRFVEQVVTNRSPISAVSRRADSASDT